MLFGAIPACSASAPSAAAQEACANYLAAKSNYVALAGSTAAAVKFAQACFDWAEFATNDAQRASVAREGIGAASFAADIAPKDPAGHLYVALNLGQLARARSLEALILVRQMERSFLKSIQLDPKFDHAAAHRSLGMLYMDAPGWPASIGGKSKARKHLQAAVELEPDYPDNYLSLLEAYVKWKERDSLRSAIERYERVLPEAKRKYSGAAWARAWRDWDERWRVILDQAKEAGVQIP